MKYALALDYEIPEGALSPYFEALRKGRAKASCCESCGAVFFPARVRCTQCNADCRSWRELSGRAEVLARSGGDKGAFALVRFEGATTLATVSLANPQGASDRGRLAAPPDGPPGLWLRLDDGRS